MTSPLPALRLKRNSPFDVLLTSNFAGMASPSHRLHSWLKQRCRHPTGVPVSGQPLDRCSPYDDALLMTAGNMTASGVPSAPSRLADPDEGISTEELALAGRNHALLLEAMRHDITPPGLHDVLVHYDVPYIDPAEWSLSVGGHVDRPFSLDLDRLRSYQPVSLPVTMECAGNGRAHLAPRPVSQPWLDGAVGTAVWTGARLADILADASPR